MNINRIGADKNKTEDVGMIELSIGDQVFQIQEKFGELEIMGRCGRGIQVMPGCRNVITITLKPEFDTN